jgi:hypothetical protein
MALDDDKSKTVHGFFSKDPEKADKEFFGRVANPDRRGFLKRTGYATMVAMVGTSIPFSDKMPIDKAMTDNILIAFAKETPND